MLRPSAPKGIDPNTGTTGFLAIPIDMTLTCAIIDCRKHSQMLIYARILHTIET